MSKIPKNLDKNPINEYPIMIFIGLGLLMLSLPWRFLAIIMIGLGVLWTFRRYQEQKKHQQNSLNTLFYKLISENRGHITALDLAMNSKLSGKVVQRFLDERAKEFGAELEITEQGGLLYYFPTAVSLVADADQVKEIIEVPVDETLGYNDELALEEVSISGTPPQHSQIDCGLQFTPENNYSEDIDKELSLTQKELAARLNVHSSTISKRKTKPDFSEWSGQKDPESISWKYLKEQARFLPINSK